MRPGMHPSVVTSSLVVALVIGLTSAARAEPIELGGETWQHAVSGGADVFTRGDGAVVTVARTPTSCSKRARTRPAARPPWAPSTYWPLVDTDGGKLALCLELGSTGAAGGDTATVTLASSRGADAGADFLPILRAIADDLRPATDTGVVGPFQPSLPVMVRQGNTLTFLVDGQPAGIGMEHVDHGTCAYDNNLVVTKVGRVADRPFAEGWYPQVGDGDNATYGCLDLREGFLSVIVTPPTQLAALQDVLAELRRAAYTADGAPLATDVEVMLPHAQQRVVPPSPGRWKVVDGARYERPGGDAFESIAPLAHDDTMYAVAVIEQPCAPGTTEVPTWTRDALFPPEAGPAWLDGDPYKVRWTAWACVAHGGQTATIAVIAALAHEDAPGPRDVAVLRPLVDAIVRSYGIEVSAPIAPAPQPSHPHEHEAVRATAAGYLGILSLAPEEGERSLGFLLGFDLRLARRHGLAFAFDAEVGRGGGEWLGEIRSGLGLGLGPLDAVVGGSVGSIGPGAAVDGYAQLGLTVDLGRPRLWLAGMYAVGLAGPDHAQVDAHLIIPGTDDNGIFLGARYLRFGDSTDDAGMTVGHGSAILFTVGGGITSQE